MEIFRGVNVYASYRYNGQSFSTFRDALDAAREKMAEQIAAKEAKLQAEL